MNIKTFNKHDRYFLAQLEPTYDKPREQIVKDYEAAVYELMHFIRVSACNLDNVTFAVAERILEAYAAFLPDAPELVEQCNSIMQSKGKDYHTERDCLSNFKEVGNAVGGTPIQVWAVYFYKHHCAIRTYFDKGQVNSEPIEMRFADAFNYCRLLWGLYKEGEGG